MKARNVRDSNGCSDRFVDQLLGEGKQFVIETLKKYWVAKIIGKKIICIVSKNCYKIHGKFRIE